MPRLLRHLELRSKATIGMAAFTLLILIGVVDYLTGFELLFSVFYLLAVGLGAWFLGRGFGLLMSVLSAVIWIGGDVAAGAHYSSALVPIWNGIILVSFYSIMVLLICWLQELYNDLETRVRQRTEDLTREMAERQRLEAELLNVSEREQQRIGHDLHDGLCQHLTATALAGQVLTERLAGVRAPESNAAAHVVSLVEEGITMARDLAHGLQPVELGSEGLRRALQELANNLRRAVKIDCRFESDPDIRIENDSTANHLYRIAQEAVGNALRHGKAKSIFINLFFRADKYSMTIEDDGVGIPEQRQNFDGMGIRIMAYRASMIAGNLSVEPAPTGGTIVTCTFPPTTRDNDNHA